MCGVDIGVSGRYFWADGGIRWEEVLLVENGGERVEFENYVGNVTIKRLRVLRGDFGTSWVLFNSPHNCFLVEP